MWGKNEPNNPIQIKAAETTYIAADCELFGKINIKGNARIDGQIDGTLAVAGNLVIGQSAVLKAAIHANTISISGEVHGDIVAREKLELSSTARLYGDIYTQQLKIEQGAHFIGSSRILDNAEKETEFKKNPEPSTAEIEESPEETLQPSDTSSLSEDKSIELQLVK